MNKSEVFRKFKEFKALIENILENGIKTLRIDNGVEYTSKDLKHSVRRKKSRGN